MADTDTRPGTTQLRRSTTDKVLGGVAGGLGRYFGIDPVLVRIAFGLSIFVGGVGVVVYLVMFLTMERCAHSVFVLLGLMAFVDVVAGFTVTIAASRRDLNLGS